MGASRPEFNWKYPLILSGVLVLSYFGFPGWIKLVALLYAGYRTVKLLKHGCPHCQRHFAIAAAVFVMVFFTLTLKQYVIGLLLIWIYFVGMYVLRDSDYQYAKKESSA